MKGLAAPMPELMVTMDVLIAAVPAPALRATPVRLRHHHLPVRRMPLI